jgi:protein-S-isoprenylcysteine O-methyltransferase Ste14
MSRLITLAFAGFAYVVFFATFLYLIGFVGDVPYLPVTVSRGPEAPIGAAIMIDLLLIALFGVQHSVMARPGFKRWWTQFVPKPAERSVYVLAASLVLVLMFALWRPIPAVIWSTSGALEVVLWIGFASGWGMVLLSTFLINHFELFGLQQAWFNLRDRAAAAPHFDQPLLYKLVRHPLYLGFFISLWIGPHMTAGRLLLASGLSVWMLIAIQLEERDLIDVFGDQYRLYRRRVGMLLPRLISRG